jgi:hypothetical protein
VSSPRFSTIAGVGRQALFAIKEQQMTADIIEKAFYSAANDFNESLALMQPYRNSEGYCEANLVAYYSRALREQNFRPFLELPIPEGRVDVLFLRGSTALLFEAKQFYLGNQRGIQDDVGRLERLDLSAVLRQYKFRNSITERFHIVLCDCWKQVKREEWDRFLSGFNKLTHPIPHNGFEYAWLLAYKEILTTS